MNSVQINIESPVLRHDYNNSIMPVIKLDFKGEILYANMSSFDLLINWNCFASSKLPKHIYENVKEGKSTFKINYNDKKINFMIVPFPEAGYVGIYAFEIISKQFHN
jgi:hypothetical protein